MRKAILIVAALIFLNTYQSTPEPVVIEKELVQLTHYIHPDPLEHPKKELSKVMILQVESTEEPDWQTFEVTAYTAGPESTGKTPDHPQYGITYSGNRVKENHTIACPKPLTKDKTAIFIEGIGTRYCEDIGSAITEGHIDIYIPDLGGAKQFGRQMIRGYIVKDDLNG